VTVVKRDRMIAGPRRSRALAWSACGLGIILIVSHAAPNIPWRLLSVLLICGGVVVLALGIWSTFGASGAEPATDRDVFNSFTGGAVVMFGLALLMIPLIDLRGSGWAVIAVAGAVALVALYGSVLFLDVSALAAKRGD
jgi:hypothetical protein